MLVDRSKDNVKLTTAASSHYDNTEGSKTFGKGAAGSTIQATGNPQQRWAIGPGIVPSPAPSVCDLKPANLRIGLGHAVGSFAHIKLLDFGDTVRPERK
ncbi:MAG: hypothetical protein FRX49_04870 [Trebouxia sp. A1-2]|nr:MAG: hypothetical protein FRX49_04870 [Trebouxia sp. A1-2]